MVEAQKRFVSDASHELRTPLAAMRAELEVTRLDEQISVQKYQSIIDSTIIEISGLQELADNLLTLSNGQQEQVRKRFGNILVLNVVEEAIKKVQQRAKKKNLTIEIAIEEELVWGDLATMTQIMVIILDNAVKYSEEGNEIRITAEQQENRVLISVEDHGCGISENDLPYVFDRFYRTDTARTKSEHSGHGLGLAIAKKLVELHDGKIWIESKVGHGTKVQILI